MGKTSDEHLGEIRERHLPLSYLDLIFNPVCGHCPVVCIQDRVSGTWISVSWLPNAAGIEE